MSDSPRSNRPTPRTSAAIEAELRRRIRTELTQARSDAENGQVDDETLADIIARAISAAVGWHLESPEHVRNSTLSSRTWRGAPGPRGGRFESRGEDSDDTVGGDRGERRGFADRQPRPFERPPRDFGDRPPRRPSGPGGGGQGFGGRPPRDFGDRPPRDFERPPRQFGPRDAEDDRDVPPRRSSGRPPFPPRGGRPPFPPRGGGGGFSRGGGFGPRRPPRPR